MKKLDIVLMFLEAFAATTPERQAWAMRGITDAAEGQSEPQRAEFSQLDDLTFIVYCESWRMASDFGLDDKS